METAPILLPSPRKSPFRAPYEHEIVLHSGHYSDEDQHSYDVSPDEAVFDHSGHDDSQDSQSSPHTSDDDVSEFPADAGSPAPSSIYTPHKRSPFRHPSSVRNLQLDTTPPHLTSPTYHHAHRHLSPASRDTTPRSQYSSHSRPRSLKSSPSKKERVKKEHPLVLLHLTLLPFSLPYTQSLLETVLSASKLSDCKLLKEKLSQAVVQERGVLIPHPKEDYDLLEERLLEALELEQGSLTRDGHFILPSVTRADSPSSRIVISAGHEPQEHLVEDDSDEEERTDIRDELKQQLCEDCGRHILSIGADRRWDVKVYAANGLMREGAWSAAWREMERVDVEIKPFISDDMKRQLESRWEEMELLSQAEQREEAAKRHEEAAVQEILQIEDASAPDEGRAQREIERLREIYGDEIPNTSFSAVENEMLYEQIPTHQSNTSSPQIEIPLSKLLVNYMRVILRDPRNLSIMFLSSLVAFLAIQATKPMSPREVLHTSEPHEHLNVPVNGALSAFMQPKKSKETPASSAIIVNSSQDVPTLETSTSHAQEPTPEENCSVSTKKSPTQDALIESGSAQAQHTLTLEATSFDQLTNAEPAISPTVEVVSQRGWEESLPPELETPISYRLAELVDATKMDQEDHDSNEVLEEGEEEKQGSEGSARLLAAEGLSVLENGIIEEEWDQDKERSDCVEPF